MRKNLAYQPSLFPDLNPEFPSTRYQGSKAKLVEQIWEQLKDLPFQTCLDAFGGTGAVAYLLKQAGKQVVYNDVLRFNYLIGVALIENSAVRLASSEVDWLLQRHSHLTYPEFVQENFSGIYFTDEENAWIDQTLTNIRQLTDPYKFALAFFALCQACIIKRPYNLFHRKNLYIRFAEVHRSFGNKATWDRPFAEWFRLFVEEANHAIFANGQENRALNLDAAKVTGEYDLVYLDPPYMAKGGIAVDYRGFYHFLEGLTMYDEWRDHIDARSKHHRLQPRPTEWMDRSQIYSAFERLFLKYQNGIIVVSYRSDGIPTIADLVSLLEQYKACVRLVDFGQYKYVLSTNVESTEMLLIGTAQPG